MSRPADFFGSSVKTVLNKPFFHAQDQKAYNVDGGSSVADAWTQRVLNTVIRNDIQGASLVSNQVQLPAGTYYVEGKFVVRDWVNSSSAIAGISKNGNVVIRGLSQFLKTEATMPVSVCGVVTLTEAGLIDLRYYVGVAVAATGLGVSNNTASITDPTLPSIYADLKIWQLDRSLEIAPKAVNSGLQTVPGLNTEGNVIGFNMLSMTGNTLTFSKGSCSDSTLEIPLAFTADKQITLPSTVNGEFFIFAVRLLDGVTFEPRAYTTLAGPSSDNQIDAWRLISYAKNGGSGVTMLFVQVGDKIDWKSNTDSPVVTTTTTASFVSYALDTVIPVGILKEITLISSTPSTATTVSVSYDGVNTFTSVPTTAVSGNMQLMINPVPAIFIKNSGNSAPIKVGSITLRR